MLSLQKSASDWTGLGYGLSSSNTASTSTSIFVPPSNNVEIENNDVKTDLASENIDKGKYILGAPPKQDKKEAKTLGLRRLTLAGHTRPNWYKWLATQQSNGMIASRSQNQLQSSLAPLGDLIKAFIFLLNLNGYRRFKGSLKGKVLPRRGRKRVPSDSITFLFLSSCFCVCITYVFYFQV